MKGSNSGFQVGGNVQAANIAVGDNATINVGGSQEVAFGTALDGVRAALADAPLSEADRAEAEAAIATLEAAKAEPDPKPDRVAAALKTLRDIGETALGLTAAAEKLAPHLLALAALFGL